MEAIPDPTLIRSLQNHRSSINWVAFSPNSQYLASASDDKITIVWTLDEENILCYKFPGHSDAVTSVALTDRFMVTGSKDCTARLYRLDQIDGVNFSVDSNVYRCHQSPVRSVDINSEETQFCTSSDDKTIKLWSANSTNRLVATLNGEHTNWIRHARYSKLHPHLISSCGDDGVICVWDSRIREAAIKLTSKRRTTHYLTVQWHPTCEHILSSSSSDTLIRLWDLRYEKTIQCYQVHDGFVSSTDFHSSGNYLISSSHDQTTKIHDLYEGRTLFTLNTHVGQINCAQFSPDGDYFATAGQDHTVLYWKSNLDVLDATYDDDDDDNRSICIDPEIPPINKFDNDEVCSIRKQYSNASLLSDNMEKLNISGTPVAKDNMSRNSSEIFPASTDKEVSSMLSSIHKQISFLAKSIATIDKRLVFLENEMIKKNNNNE